VEYRPFGKTGLSVSALGFGCGNVGGLMVRGTPAERERAVARAMELGINYFDTAALYGDGLSEQHLGQALNALKAPVHVGTKFRLSATDLASVRTAVVSALEGSLKRLGREQVDLFQLHNLILRGRERDRASVRDVVQEVVPALQDLRRQGKIRFLGFTALGDTQALHEVIDAGLLDTAQVCFNMLNPSAGHPVPTGFPGQDFGRLLDRAQAKGVGTIGIRVLAAGALSGVVERHPVAVPTVDPIASGPDYDTDVRRAQAFRALVAEGHAADLVEASLRFAISSPAMSTVLLGYSDLGHLEHAAAAVAKGPLPSAALDRLRAIWNDLAGAR
jgi:aryl-alcohol dehydrogenase-like predicted oxidoreductase